jgi:hypothetical protein
MTGIAVVTGLSSAEFIWTNFSTSGGNWLVAVNGADPVKNYNGTVWSNPSITNVTSSTLNYVFQFKSRLFFLKKDTSQVWFLPTDSVAGAAASLAVAPELTLGGTLVAGAAFTYDGGFGPDDYCVFISSEGEVVIYTGTDPANATDWNLKGVFRIGRPIGNRCIVKIGGDIAVLTQDGVISLSNAFALDRSAEQKAAFTSNIRRAFTDQYTLSGTVTGWQLLTWPAGHLALVNVPVAAGTTFYQYIMNVLTGAWTRYTNINSLCWAIAGDDLYFGTADGFVMIFGNAGSDNGADIQAVSVGAFSEMRQQGVIKHIKAAMVFARAAGNYQLGVNMASDFRLTDTAAASIGFNGVSSGGALWGSALWGTATWSSTSSVLANEAWMGVSEEGYFIAPVVLTQANEVSPSNVEFIAMNVLYETGSPLG